jgi:truncated hemoglobin YjbI
VKKLSLSVLLFAGASACVVACGSDDDPVNSNGGTGGGGKAGASTAGAAGKAGGGSGGTSGGGVEAGSGGEAGGPVETTLYERLGGHDGIAAAVHAIVLEELKDPFIASYFSQLAAPGHKPTGADIEGCLVEQLGAAAGGEEVYPTTLANGYVCRSMSAAHATLGIGSGTFDLFVSIAAETLTAAGVAPADVETIGGVLNGTKAAIVDKNAASGAGPCKSPASCALPIEPGEGGAGGEAGAAAP